MIYYAVTSLDLMTTFIKIYRKEITYDYILELVKVEIKVSYKNLYLVRNFLVSSM